MEVVRTRAQSQTQNRILSQRDLDIDLDEDMNNVTDISDPDLNSLNSHDIEINNIMDGLDRTEFSTLSELKDFATAIYNSRS